MNKLFLLSILLSVFFVSCSDLKKKERIEKITNMEKSLDSIDRIMKSEKNESLNEMALAAQGVELRIKNNFNLDTINIEFGKKMDAYKRMRRAIPKLKSNLNKVEKSIVEMRKSLKNLKTDIENNSGKREKYDEYIKFELNKLSQIKILFKDCQSAQLKVMDTYRSLHSELYAFSLSLVKDKL